MYYMETRLIDTIAGWKERCADYFPYSTYFGGSRSSATIGLAHHLIRQTSENGVASLNSDQDAASVSSNGQLQKLEGGFKDLVI